jgi:hypothetical protein
MAYTAMYGASMCCHCHQVVSVSAEVEADAGAVMYRESPAVARWSVSLAPPPPRRLHGTGPVVETTLFPALYVVSHMYSSGWIAT